mmetsp:Transcript_121056/g.210178  ORF Transcript_121056/g.210178 Transcript_121056/m.210178 type:complete len:117 (-) Transcript_121056:68-418(-)
MSCGGSSSLFHLSNLLPLTSLLQMYEVVSRPPERMLAKMWMNYLSPDVCGWSSTSLPNVQHDWDHQQQGLFAHDGGSPLVPTTSAQAAPSACCPSTGRQQRCRALPTGYSSVTFAG